MDLNTLRGIQYVRLAPNAAAAVAPYLGLDPAEIDELVLDILIWPAQVRPVPLRARDGRLVAGDPVLLGADDRGLVFAAHPDPVVVPWQEIRHLEVLGVIRQPTGV